MGSKFPSEASENWKIQIIAFKTRKMTVISSWYLALKVS